MNEVLAVAVAVVMAVLVVLVMERLAGLQPPAMGWMLELSQRLPSPAATISLSTSSTEGLGLVELLSSAVALPPRPGLG